MGYDPEGKSFIALLVGTIIGAVVTAGATLAHSAITGDTVILDLNFSQP